MLVVQNEARPAAMRHAIADLIVPQLDDVKIASAYVTMDGVKLVLEALARRIEPARLAQTPKLLIASLDFGLTDPAALEAWSLLPNAEVRVAGGQRVRDGSLKPRIAFHPKLYLFGHGETLTGGLIGSANLTGRGLSVNTEAGWAQADIPRAEADRAFAEAGEGAEILSTGLLQLYRDLRAAEPPPAPVAGEIERVSPPQQVQLEGLLQFGEAIDADAVDPAQFEQFWVQAEGLQGGSRNQLELPRGANRFFGFAFNQYRTRNAVRIGELRLVGGLQAWADRPLAWHGNNLMERLNLPTLAQGGFAYENSAILFRRLPNGEFELVVAGWETDLARAWREASIRNGTLFKVGARGGRLAGLI